MARKADSAQSVPAALDAIMLDENWQRALSDEERWRLVEWAQRTLSGAFEAKLLIVRQSLAEIGRMPNAMGERDRAIQALLAGALPDGAG